MRIRRLTCKMDTVPYEGSKSTVDKNVSFRYFRLLNRVPGTYTGCPKSKVTISNCYGFTIFKHKFIIYIPLEQQ